MRYKLDRHSHEKCYVAPYTYLGTSSFGPIVKSVGNLVIKGPGDSATVATKTDRQQGGERAKASPTSPTLSGRYWYAFHVRTSNDDGFRRRRRRRRVDAADLTAAAMSFGRRRKAVHKPC